MDNIKLQYPFK